MTDTASHQSWWKELGTSTKDLILRNGGLFTIFGVVFIIFGGITLVNNPQNWWMVALVIVGLGATAFLFMNARVVIKAILTIVLTLMFSSFGFSVAAATDPYSTGALVWPLAAWFLFFASLALSYAIPSGRSRWGSMMFSQITYFVVAAVLSLSTGDAILAIILGVVFGLLAFSLLQFFTKKSRAQREHMPLNVLDDNIRAKLKAAADATNRDYVDLSDPETDRGSFLVWNDRAYLLYPVKMDSSFSIVGNKKRTQMGYHSRPINPWLLNLVFQETPSWRSRGADITTVLVDLNGANGGDPKVIGVSLPDTKKVMPVGVIPGRVLQSNEGDPADWLQQLDAAFAEFTDLLTYKQAHALDRMIPDTRYQEEN